MKTSVALISPLKWTFSLKMLSYHIHVNAVGVRPSMLEVLLETLTKRIGDLVEAYELFNLLHLCVVASCARVQPLNDGAHVTKDTSVHKSCVCEVVSAAATASTATAVVRKQKEERGKKNPLTIVSSKLLSLFNSIVSSDYGKILFKSSVEKNLFLFN